MRKILSLNGQQKLMLDEIKELTGEKDSEVFRRGLFIYHQSIKNPTAPNVIVAGGSRTPRDGSAPVGRPKMTPEEKKKAKIQKKIDEWLSGYPLDTPEGKHIEHSIGPDPHEGKEVGLLERRWWLDNPPEKGGNVNSTWYPMPD